MSRIDTFYVNHLWALTFLTLKIRRAKFLKRLRVVIELWGLDIRE